MRKIILLIFACTLFNYAQSSDHFKMNGNGEIKGTVLDSSNSQPIEFATVMLIKGGTTKVLGGAITDKNGNFIMDGVPEGKYKLKITCLNYYDKFTDEFEVSKNKLRLNFKDLQLGQATLRLKDVTVTAVKEAIEFKGDKMVVNVEKTLPPAGGSAIDVLKNTPSVNVDMDGNVSLRGNSNINIQIDGRPSGMSDTKMLEQLPADMIDKIEIITNPSARYDAEGTAGIINLVLKKKEQSNFNGLASVNAGTQDNYSSSVSFNYRKNSLNVYGSYDNRFNHRSGTGDASRTNLTPGYYNTINMDNDFNYKGQSHNIKGGLDYSLDKYNTISTSISYNNGKGNRGANIVSNTLDSLNNQMSSYTSSQTGKNTGSVIDYNLNYKQTFDTPEKQWTVDLYYSDSKNDEDTYRDQINHYASIIYPYMEKTASDNTNKVVSGKTDYVLPINDDTKFETGYKGLYRERTIDYALFGTDSLLNYNLNTTLSNDFYYKEQIHAAYVMFSSALQAGVKFKYQLGLRAENSYHYFNQKTQSIEHTANFLDFFPTLNLSAEVSKGQEFRLGYSRRINRPNMYLINPFVRKMDDYTYYSGNPDLKPEYIDSYELGHSIFLGTTSIFSTLFYRQVNNNINVVVELEPNNIIHQTFKNISKQKSYGVEINANSQLFKWWNLNGGYSYYATKFEGYSDNTTTPKNVWYARLSSMWNLGDGFTVQFNGYYSSPMALPQGKMKGIFYSDAGIKKTLMDGALSVGLRVQDIFKAMKYNSDVTGINFIAHSNNNMNSQIFTLSLTYNINNFQQKREKRPEDDNGGKEYENMGNN